MITTITIDRINYNTETGERRLTKIEDFIQYENMINRCMLADGYKYSHAKQYPENTESMFDYGEARSGKIYDKTVFNGLQPKLKKFFTKPIEQWEVDEAFMYSQEYGVYFDVEGWDYIVQVLNGFLPVTIKAVAEGTVVPTSNVLFTVKSTNKKVFWVASWFETILMTVWYPCNVATRSYYVRELLEHYAERTQDEPNVDFQYHNFGARGSTNPEAAEEGGMAHLIPGFMGSDNFSAMRAARRYYNIIGIQSIMYSINATEHSSTTAWTKENEMDMIMNHLEENKGKAIIAAVLDSYDYAKAVREVCKEGGKFQAKINDDRYPVFVMRPDSGKPDAMINLTLDIMEDENVPFIYNKKGYKVFKKMRIIYGDGINMEAMELMLEILINRGYSSENLAFGSGGWLMQQHDRDTQGWAVKCSSIKVNGEDRDVYKDPITAPNKKSKKGELTLWRSNETGEYFTGGVNFSNNFSVSNMLRTVYENGVMKTEYTLEEARANCSA